MTSEQHDVRWAEGGAGCTYQGGAKRWLAGKRQLEERY